MKGVDIKVKIDDIFVGGQRGATLNRSAETIDGTTKDSGEWAQSEPGLRSWSVDFDGLVVADDTGYIALEDAIMNNTTVVTSIKLPSGTVYSGTAIVTDCPIEAPHDDNVTYSGTLQGTGPLTKVIGSQGGD